MKKIEKIKSLSFLVIRRELFWLKAIGVLSSSLFLFAFKFADFV